MSDELKQEIQELRHDLGKAHAAKSGFRIMLKRAESECAHWKSNHDNQVRAARLLRERPDLPIERIKAYDELVALRAELEALKATADEDAYVIDRLGNLLAGVAIELKGPERPLHRHGYQDLVELAAKMKLELDLHRLAAAVPAVDAITYPDEMTASVREVLSMMCFQFIKLAAAFRAGGNEIEHKAEAEQAFCLHFFLKHALRHGDLWRQEAGVELMKMKDDTLAASQVAGGDANEA